MNVIEAYQAHDTALIIKCLDGCNDVICSPLHSVVTSKQNSPKKAQLLLVTAGLMAISKVNSTSKTDSCNANNCLQFLVIYWTWIAEIVQDYFCDRIFDCIYIILFFDSFLLRQMNKARDIKRQGVYVKQLIIA